MWKLLEKSIFHNSEFSKFEVRDHPKFTGYPCRVLGGPLWERLFFLYSYKFLAPHCRQACKGTKKTKSSEGQEKSDQNSDGHKKKGDQNSDSRKEEVPPKNNDDQKSQILTKEDIKSVFGEFFQKEVIKLKEQ